MRHLIPTTCVISVSLPKWQKCKYVLPYCIQNTTIVTDTLKSEKSQRGTIFIHLRLPMKGVLWVVSTNGNNFLPVCFNATLFIRCFNQSRHDGFYIKFIRRGPTQFSLLCNEHIQYQYVSIMLLHSIHVLSSKKADESDYASIYQIFQLKAALGLIVPADVVSCNSSEHYFYHWVRSQIFDRNKTEWCQQVMLCKFYCILLQCVISSLYAFILISFAL